MNNADWEARYVTNDMPWEKGEASPGLVDFLKGHPELPRGTVAVPGCGTGHDVRAWAGAGFTASGFDGTPFLCKPYRARMDDVVAAKIALPCYNFRPQLSSLAQRSFAVYERLSAHCSHDAGI